MKKPFKLPKFKNEDEERSYWAKLDLSKYYDSEDFVPVSFPNLKLPGSGPRRNRGEKEKSFNILSHLISQDTF